MKNNFLSVARVEPGTIGSIAEHSYHYAISAYLGHTADFDRRFCNKEESISLLLWILLKRVAC